MIECTVIRGFIDGSTFTKYAKDDSIKLSAKRCEKLESLGYVERKPKKVKKNESK